MPDKYKNGKKFLDRSQYHGPNKPWTKKKDLDLTGTGTNGEKGRCVGEHRRADGSTHKSETKARIKRNGKRKARQESQKLIKEET